MAKKYPDKPRGGVLWDLVQLTPGDEGKWFAAAKDARLFDEAVALAKYEITSAEVWAAYSDTIKAAANVDGGHDIRHRILALIDSAGARGGFVARIIGRELGLP